jgi:AcrR family transcriptional regulator
MSRTYRLGKRAEAAAATRKKIVDAAMQLHRSVGPRATTVAEIARIAGVERLTVYNHFPEDRDLVTAAQSQWLSLHPQPDPYVWAGIDNPTERLRAALLALYGWYEATEPMTRNVLADGPALPSFAGVLGGMAANEREVLDFLAAGWQPTPWAMATIRTGVAFPTWDRLCKAGGLASDEAVALVIAWVKAA